MSKPVKISNERWLCTRPAGYALRSERSDDQLEINGTVHTPHGMIEVSHYAWTNHRTGGRVAQTVLEWQLGAVVHLRRVNGPEYTRRGLITLARRFAADMARNSPHTP